MRMWVADGIRHRVMWLVRGEQAVGSPGWSHKPSAAGSIPVPASEVNGPSGFGGAVALPDVVVYLEAVTPQSPAERQRKYRVALGVTPRGGLKPCGTRAAVARHQRNPDAYGALRDCEACSLCERERQRTYAERRRRQAGVQPRVKKSKDA